MFKTMMLRFRDLVTSTGDTIKLHKSIIDEHPTKAVWWGWWAKPGEQCPRDLMNLTVKISRENPLDIYLFDSGQCEIYKATMIGLSTNVVKHICPHSEPPKTPEYYANQSYHAWFEFSVIEKVSEDIIKGFAYSDNIKDFFTNKDSFKIYERKQVSSLRELQSQDRTIWFLEDFVEGDHLTHEIILSNANVSIPSIFPGRPVDISSGKIIWFSDLHFDEREEFHQFGKNNVRSLDLIINQTNVGGAAPLDIEGLIVSGDFTWRATAKEFEMADNFLRNLCSIKKLTIDGIGICPGNHDVSFSDDYEEEVKEALVKYHKMQQGGGDLSEDEWQRLVATDVLPEYKSNYQVFFRKITGTSPNKFLSMGKRYLIKNQKIVDVCFLNSNSLQQHKLAFQGQGYVGAEQMSEAEAGMGWNTNKKISGGFRVVVIHHNLIPVNYTNLPQISAPSGLVYDTQAIFKWCFDNGVDLVLHGHTHERFINKITRKRDDVSNSLWIVGLGSTGVIKEHLEGKNELAELDFNQDEIYITFYDISNNDITLSEKVILD